MASDPPTATVDGSDSGGDEAEMVLRAQAGEQAAFGRLVERHADPLWRRAWALCGDAHEAEDLAVETLAEAWRSIGRCDARRSLAAWLAGILRHRFLKSRRRRRPERPGPHTAAEPASQTAAPDALTAAAEEAAGLRAAVAALPAEHRAVVELRFFAGASLDEIAALLDCPLGTVKSRLHHGLGKLRRRIGGDAIAPTVRASQAGMNLSGTAGEYPLPNRRGRS